MPSNTEYSIGCVNFLLYLALLKINKPGFFYSKLNKPVF